MQFKFASDCKTEVWRDCRNVKGGWRCTTERGEDLFIHYSPDYAERWQLGPARVPDPNEPFFVRRHPDGRFATSTFEEIGKPDGAEAIGVIIELRPSPVKLVKP